MNHRKQRGPQRNSVDISPVNVSSSICFHSTAREIAMMTSHYRNNLKNSKTRISTYLLQYLFIFVDFLKILSRDPATLNSNLKEDLFVSSCRTSLTRSWT